MILIRYFVGAILCVIFRTATSLDFCDAIKGDNLAQASALGKWYTVARGIHMSVEFPEFNLEYLSDNVTLQLNITITAKDDEGRKKVKSFTTNITTPIDEKTNYYAINGDYLHSLKLLDTEYNSRNKWRIFCGFQYLHGTARAVQFITTNESALSQNELSSIFKQLDERYKPKTKRTSGDMCTAIEGVNLNPEIVLGEWHTVAVHNYKNGTTYFPKFNVEFLSDDVTLQLNISVAYRNEKGRVKTRTYMTNITTPFDVTNTYRINGDYLHSLKLLDTEYNSCNKWRIFCGLEFQDETVSYSVGFIMANQRVVNETELLHINDKLAERYYDFEQNSFSTHYKLTTCNDGE